MCAGNEIHGVVSFDKADQENPNLFKLSVIIRINLCFSNASEIA